MRKRNSRVWENVNRFRWDRLGDAIEAVLLFTLILGLLSIPGWLTYWFMPSSWQSHGDERFALGIIYLLVASAVVALLYFVVWKMVILDSIHWFFEPRNEEESK